MQLDMSRFACINPASATDTQIQGELTLATIA